MSLARLRSVCDVSNWYRARGKRLCDAATALVAIAVLSPVFALLWILIQRLLGSPVLFRQERPGLHGQTFTLIKFRSMLAAADQRDGPLSDEARLTPFGRALRSTSLDELPELWNVVRGDMSLVGPRPLLRQYLKRYTPEQARRHEVRPGITGWAQVNGRNALSWEGRFKLDVWYVDNLSWLLDVKILALTVWKILSREGISSPGLATMHEFQGAEGESPASQKD